MEGQDGPPVLFSAKLDIIPRERYNETYNNCNFKTAGISIFISGSMAKKNARILYDVRSSVEKRQ